MRFVGDVESRAGNRTSDHALCARTFSRTGQSIVKPFFTAVRAPARTTSGNADFGPHLFVHLLPERLLDHLSEVRIAHEAVEQILVLFHAGDAQPLERPTRLHRVSLLPPRARDRPIAPSRKQSDRSNPTRRRVTGSDPRSPRAG